MMDEAKIRRADMDLLRLMVRIERNHVGKQEILAELNEIRESLWEALNPDEAEKLMKRTGDEG